MRMKCAALIAVLLAVVGCRPPPADAAAPGGPIDADGVIMLLPSANDSGFLLGEGDPNTLPGFEIEKHGLATELREGARRFWRIDAYSLEYSSGGSGKTSRIHVNQPGSSQHFDWRTQHGFLSSPQDFKNQEFTAYLRVHGIFDLKRAAVSLKIRGGRHTRDAPDLASCTMMTFAPAGAPAVTRFGKELRHPDYDYIKLTPLFDTALMEDAWFALKLVSYQDPRDRARVINQLYVDPRPFDAGGRPRNDFRLLSVFEDVEGVSTGHYSKLVDWGGSRNTVRSDGIAQLDFAIVSVREIQPRPD
jgi:hypothetical protein